jgi:hypothetical protein
MSASYSGFVYGCLLGPFPDRVNGSRTDGQSRNGPGEFVPGKFKKSFLIGALPVWERTALNVKGNDFIALAHRVRTEVGPESSGDFEV